MSDDEEEGVISLPKSSNFTEDFFKATLPKEPQKTKLSSHKIVQKFKPLKPKQDIDSQISQEGKDTPIYIFLSLVAGETGLPLDKLIIGLTPSGMIRVPTSLSHSVRMAYVTICKFIRMVCRKSDRSRFTDNMILNGMDEDYYIYFVQCVSYYILMGVQNHSAIQSNARHTVNIHIKFVTAREMLRRAIREKTKFTWT